jgi:hypothetical protein
MSQYRFLHQYIPQENEIPIYFEQGFLFNELPHVHQQNNGCVHLLSALNTATRLVEARCYFSVQSTKAVSPAAAPFGSIEFAGNLPDHVLNDFIQRLTQVAANVGAKTLQLVNYPHCYAPVQADKLTGLLVKQGFSLTETSGNFHIPVTNQPFEQTITSAEYRRLQRCQHASFQFNEWLNPDIDFVTSYLVKARMLQNYPLSIPASRLADLLCLFPDKFVVFVVKDGSTVAALTIAVRVRKDILYYYLPASHPDYRSFSPMVMLIAGLYRYCQQHGISLLDLGVSLDNNRLPKPSLMRFKRNVGAQESLKLTFEKSL